MGNIFTKVEPIQLTNTKINESSNIAEIIQQYEYIKNKKHITDIDKIVKIMKNTNWDKEFSPSAPPMPVAQPIINSDTENIDAIIIHPYEQTQIIQIAKIIK